MHSRCPCQAKTNLANREDDLKRIQGIHWVRLGEVGGMSVPANSQWFRDLWLQDIMVDVRYIKMIARTQLRLLWKFVHSSLAVCAAYASLRDGCVVAL